MSWSALGFIFSKLLTFATAVYLSRLIGKVHYGELGVVLNSVGLFGIFAGAGMGMAATKYIASFRKIDIERVSRILGLTIICTFAFSVLTLSLVLYFTVPLATNWLNNNALTGALRFSCLLLIANVTFEVLSAILAGFEDFKSNSLAEMLRGIIVFPVILLLAPEYQVEGAVTAYSVASFLAAFYLYYRVRIILRINDLFFDIKHAHQEFSVITKFSLPALIAMSLPLPAIWLSTVLLAHTPNGYSELGVYNASNQLRMFIMTIPILLSRVLVPLLAQEHEANNNSGYTKAIDGANFATIAIILPVSTVLLFLGEQIMALFGKDFSQGWPVLILITAGTSVSAIGSVIGSAVIATGYMWAGVLQNLIWATTYVIFVVVQYKQFGALALANSFLIAHLVLLAITVVFLYRRELVSRKMLGNIFISAGAVVVIALIALSLTTGMRLLIVTPASVFIFWACIRWLMPDVVQDFIHRKGGLIKVINSCWKS